MARRALAPTTSAIAIVRREAGPRRAAVHVRRGRRRGRHRRGRRWPTSRPASRSASLHDLPRPAGRHPAACRSATAARPPLRLTTRDERVARPARRRLGPRPAERAPGPASGTSSSGRSCPAASRSAACAGRPAHQHNPFLALRRPATTEDRGRGVSASAWSTRATSWPRPRSTRCRHDPGPPRDRPRGFRWRLDPGAAFDAPEAVLVYSDRGPRRPERRVPPPLSRAPGPRDVARPAAPGR